MRLGGYEDEEYLDESWVTVMPERVEDDVPYRPPKVLVVVLLFRSLDSMLLSRDKTLLRLDESSESDPCRV